MDVVAPHLADPPARGDFAVVQAGSEALILRIAGAYPTGSFAEASDRGADYLAQLARQPSQVPERIRELLLRFRVEVDPLGWLRQKNGKDVFESGVRAIQLFGRPVHRPSRELLTFLVNAGLEHEDPKQIVRLGVFARGHEQTDIPVQFSIRRLKGRRTFVFARAGYGKSNLTKLLLSRLYSAPPDVGLLIVDPEGEYAFSQRSETGSVIPGLVDHELVRDRVRVFTDRKGMDDARIAGGMRVDMAKLSPGEFVSAFIGDEKHGQVWVSYLRRASPTTWADLIGLLRRDGFASRDEVIAKILHLGQRKPGDVSLQAIRNNVIPVLERLDGPESDLLETCLRQLLGQGKTPPGVVILDVSTKEGRDADALVRLVMHKIFRRAVDTFTEHSAEKRPGVLLVLEEAQSVLGHRQMNDTDIYVRWVKEGRKYGLGAMMITQQPGALAHELVSQGDNFFVMHLLAQRDLDVLGAANAHFSSEILEFIRDEPVKGNCYFWSAPDQPYVVAVRVDPYEDLAVARRVPTGTPAPRGLSYIQRLRDEVVRALAAESRVYLYRVVRLDDRSASGIVAVDPDYLAGNVGGAAGFQAETPEDWEERAERTSLRMPTLEGVLASLALAADPARARGARESRTERPMLLVREERLRALASSLGVAVKNLRREELDLRS